jgi:hypothetical protein
MSNSNPPHDRAHPVGYKNPPAQHQFRKGVSGNPKGRPAKAQKARLPGPAHAELDDILLKEALRPITLRENDQLIELPMIQAVLRSLGVAAVKGHHRSQLALAGMVKQVQAARYDERKVLFQEAMEYKEGWRRNFEDCDRRGVPRPQPVPHPDEIVLDMKTMDVKFNGPVTDDDKARWDMMLQRKADALEEIALCRQKLKRPSKYKAIYEAEIADEQRYVDLVDTVIPDEKLRRRPGFDLHEWQDSNPKYQALTKRVAAREKAKKKSTTGQR